MGGVAERAPRLTAVDGLEQHRLRSALVLEGREGRGRRAHGHGVGPAWIDAERACVGRGHALPLEVPRLAVVVRAEHARDTLLHGLPSIDAAEARPREHDTRL